MFYFKPDFYKTTRFKTTVLYSALFLLLEFTSALVLYFYIRSVLVNDLNESLKNQANLIHQLLTEKKLTFTDFQPDSVYTPQEEYVINLLHQAVALNPRNTFIQVKYNDDLIFLTDNLKKHEMQPLFKLNQEFSMIAFEDTSISNYEIRAVLLYKNNYQIMVAAPTALLKLTLNHIVNVTIYLTPFFLLLAIVGGAIISYKALARIDQIINKTQEITAQNLAEGIPGGEYDDEYGRLARTLNEMTHRVKQSVDYVNQFNVAVSHELKTPLTILQGEIELSLRSPRTTDQYIEVLKSNYEETLRLKKIVEQLFLISKFDFSLAEIKKEPISVERILYPIINTQKKLAAEKNKKLQLEIPQDEIIIMAESNLLRNALTNLVENAIKYADKDSIIYISSERTAGHKVKISINNRGRIIPSEVQEKIFERFFRSEGSRHREPGGIGLGLTITKTIVELHNGRIWVESNNEVGTTFNIILDAVH